MERTHALVGAILEGRASKVSCNELDAVLAELDVVLEAALRGEAPEALETLRGIAARADLALRLRDAVRLPVADADPPSAHIKLLRIAVELQRFARSPGLVAQLAGEAVAQASGLAAQLGRQPRRGTRTVDLASRTEEALAIIQAMVRWSLCAVGVLRRATIPHEC